MEPASHEDIVVPGEGVGWLVVGWFTPDYRELAARLSADLRRVAAPHHLYARELAPGGWLANCLRKPEVLRTAFEDHPGQTLMLFDVDMQVAGRLDELAATPGDVVVSSATKRGDAVPWRRRKRRLHIASRVMVWKSTAAARRLLEAWDRECRRPGIRYGDETAFIEAYAASSGVAVSRMDQRFAGARLTTGSRDAVVIHDSAHDKRLPWHKQVRKTLRRWRRVGASRAGGSIPADS